MVIGAALELIWLGFLVLIVVGAVTFVMGKIRGPKKKLKLDHPLDTERLPR